MSNSNSTENVAETNPLADSLSAGGPSRESKQKDDARQEASNGGRTIRLNAEVPTDLYEDFRAVAEARERSISGEIRQVMRKHVEQHRLRNR